MKVKKRTYIRWLGAIASSVMLGAVVLETGNCNLEGEEPISILVGLVIFILTPFLNIFLTAFGHFWMSFVVGLVIFILSLSVMLDGEISTFNIILFLSSATLCITPFLNRACRTKNI